MRSCRVNLPNRYCHLAFLLVSIAAFARAEVVSVDVYEWARTGTGVTPGGWTVNGVASYKVGGATFHALGDYAISPDYRGQVTQLVVRVCSSQPDLQRNLTAKPESADPAARTWTMDCTPEQKFVEQSFAWHSSERVRQFRFQIFGKLSGNWYVGSLDVYIDRVEAPQELREEKVYSDALSVAWTPDPRAVSNEFELCRITDVPPGYDLLRDWDFTSLTNTSGNSKSFLELDPPDELLDVEGTTLCLQGNDGGHLQIGNTKTGGAMRLSLPVASGREAVMRLLRSDKDGNFSAVIAAVGTDGQTNTCAQIPLVPDSRTSVVTIADEATALLVISERGDNRIRVEDVKVVTGYVPGYVMTNEVARCRIVRNVRTVKGLDPGDFIWRVRSFDGQGVLSAWSPYRAVTLSKDDPKMPRSGFAVILK